MKFDVKTRISILILRYFRSLIIIQLEHSRNSTKKNSFYKQILINSKIISITKSDLPDRFLSIAHIHKMN